MQRLYTAFFGKKGEAVVPAENPNYMKNFRTRLEAVNALIKKENETNKQHKIKIPNQHVPEVFNCCVSFEIAEDPFMIDCTMDHMVDQVSYQQLEEMHIHDNTYRKNPHSREPIPHKIKEERFKKLELEVHALKTEIEQHTTENQEETKKILKEKEFLVERYKLELQLRTNMENYVSSLEKITTLKIKIATIESNTETKLNDLTELFMCLDGFKTLSKDIPIKDADDTSITSLLKNIEEHMEEVSAQISEITNPQLPSKKESQQKSEELSFFALMENRIIELEKSLEKAINTPIDNLEDVLASINEENFDKQAFIAEQEKERNKTILSLMLSLQEAIEQFQEATQGLVLVQKEKRNSGIDLDDEFDMVLHNLGRIQHQNRHLSKDIYDLKVKLGLEEKLKVSNPSNELSQMTSSQLTTSQLRSSSFARSFLGLSSGPRLGIGNLNQTPANPMLFFNTGLMNSTLTTSQIRSNPSGNQTPSNSTPISTLRRSSETDN